jgi:hypothetical protein
MSIQYFNTGQYSDVDIILVDNEQSITLKLHRNIMASNSKYFERLFVDDKREFIIHVQKISTTIHLFRRFYGDETPQDIETELQILKLKSIFMIDVEPSDYWLNSKLIKPQHYNLVVEVIHAHNMDLSGSRELVEYLSSNMPVDYDISQLYPMRGYIITGKRILIASHQRAGIRCWNFDTGKIINTIVTGRIPKTYTYPEKDKILYTHSDIMYTCDITGDPVINHIGGIKIQHSWDSQYYYWKVLTKGNQFAITYLSGQIKIYDADIGKCDKTLWYEEDMSYGDLDVTKLRIVDFPYKNKSQDSNRFLVYSFMDSKYRTIKMYSAKNHELTDVTNVFSKISGVLVAKGKYLVISHDNEATMYRIKSGEQKYRFAGHHRDISSMKTYKNRLITLCHRELMIWSIKNGDLEYNIIECDKITALRVDNNMNWILYAVYDKIIIRSGDTLDSIKYIDTGCSERIYKLVLIDADKIISLSYKDMRLLDINTGQVIRTFENSSGISKVTYKCN